MTPAARQRAELTGRLASLLARFLPGLAEETARAAVEQAAKTVPGCAVLIEHLHHHPDALRSGSSRVPLPLVRLAHALAAAGVPGVVLPGCAGCGKAAADLRSWPGTGLACQSCYQDARRRPLTGAGSAASSRWQQFQRCLHDPALPHHVRVAGALLLLYGHPISRTVQLKATQLSHADGNTYLAFGQHPVLLPPVLAQLIRELHATATPTAVLGGRGSPTNWLFPGQVPGRHMSVNGLVRQLNHHGIQARIARSAALINLAADLPAAVLADLLGMHINTAVRWAHRAKRDWASYLAARSADSRAPVGTSNAKLLPVVA